MLFIGRRNQAGASPGGVHQRSWTRDQLSVFPTSQTCKYKVTSGRKLRPAGNAHPTVLGPFSPPNGRIGSFPAARILPDAGAGASAESVSGTAAGATRLFAVRGPLWLLTPIRASTPCLVHTPLCSASSLITPPTAHLVRGQKPRAASAEPRSTVWKPPAARWRCDAGPRSTLRPND